MKSTLVEKIRLLSDGDRSAVEIATDLGCRKEYVRKIWSQYKDMPRPKRRPPLGAKNPAWTGGRVIQRCGRILIPAPENHPYARCYGNKRIGRILEHRAAMEKELGRYLLPEEVVDHIDGCVLHNDPQNLRVFPSNAAHLKATITGVPKDNSALGTAAMKSRHSGQKNLKQVSNYHSMWRCGDWRLLQILLAHVLLDKDSPYLLGTHRYMTDRQIDFSQRDVIAREFVAIHQKWELNHRLSRYANFL